jgi:Fur family peroxide stress response transcriptional regulator
LEVVPLKYSRQREEIRRFLSGRTDHPTAEMIYEGLKPEMSSLSLGTVYRNLSLLAENGEIQRISNVDGSDRFDPNPKPHYHFHCEKCGRVEDIPMTSMESLNHLAQAHLGGRVYSHDLMFHGICADCLKKSETGEPEDLISTEAGNPGTEVSESSENPAEGISAGDRRTAKPTVPGKDGAA